MGVMGMLWVCLFCLFSEVEGILEKLGGDKEMVKESILITCNEQNQAQFSLDVGKKNTVFDMTVLQLGLR